MSGPGVVLFGDSGSTYTRAVRLGLLEKAIPFAFETVQFDDPAWRRVHPFGKVPALRDGDLLLYESQAILRHLDRTRPGPPLEPADPAARAHADQYVSALADYVFRPVMHGLVGAYVFGDGRPTAAAVAEALPPVVTALDIVEDWLRAAPGPFLFGDRPLLPDLFLGPWLAYLALLPEGASLLGARPGLAAHLRAWHTRPAFQETAPPGGPFGR